ncbi:MAG: alpha/beta fold hydrolase [Bacteroidia bacterium]|nr:alpha/beta fold hydrolase [Bacteroidia bacterium]
MRAFTFFFLLLPTLMTAQDLKIRDYEFVSRSKDTVQAELGTFMVPEDRSNPDSREIKISFIRFKSTNPNPGSPIVYLAGGPGGSGIQTARSARFDLFMKLREVADVIAYDQRGTGWSNSLPSFVSMTPLDASKPMDRETYVKISLDNIEAMKTACKDAGAKLEAYNTTENAHDIDDLRKALGEDKISIWGISYGSHLSFEYIRLFEENIDRAVIASMEGPDHTIKLPSNTEAFINMLCERAKDNYGFEPKYPNLREKINYVHDKLKQEPVILTFEDKRGKSQTVGFNNFELQVLMANMYLRDPWDIKKYARIYSEMYEGDYSSIAPRMLQIKQFALSRMNPMAFAMDMSSGMSAERNAQIKAERETTTYGPALSFIMYDWMNADVFPMLPDEFRVQKKNKVKALLVSGMLDGRTYVSAAKEIAKNFKNGHHVILDHAGHNLFMLSEELQQLVVDFFAGEDVSDRKIELEPVPFE